MSVTISPDRTRRRPRQARTRPGRPARRPPGSRRRSCSARYRHRPVGTEVFVISATYAAFREGDRVIRTVQLLRYLVLLGTPARPLEQREAARELAARTARWDTALARRPHQVGGRALRRGRPGPAERCPARGVHRRGRRLCPPPAPSRRPASTRRSTPPAPLPMHHGSIRSIGPQSRETLERPVMRYRVVKPTCNRSPTATETSQSATRRLGRVRERRAVYPRRL